MKKKYEIAASLEYGKFYSKNYMFFFYLGFFLSIIYFFSLILAGIFASEFYFLSMLFLPKLLFIGSVCLIIPNRKLKVKIDRWTEDAVELEAYSKAIDSFQYRAAFNRVNKGKIQVSFEYEGKRIVRCSGLRGYQKPNAYNTKAGYEGIFRKYENKMIHILYSPKYDQVLLLKENEK